MIVYRFARRALLVALFFSYYDVALAQDWQVVRENSQRSFAKTVPAGNYSGITHLYDEIYAVVSDKSDSALYFNFRIQVDSVTGDLVRVENLGHTVRVDGRGYDHEAIVKVSDSTVVVASEGKCWLKEYPINIPNDILLEEKTSVYPGSWAKEWDANEFYPNYNFESLAYDSARHYLWTIPESALRKDGTPASPEHPVANKLRLLQYHWQGNEKGRNKENEVGDKEIRGLGDESEGTAFEYVYLMDAPSTSRKAQTYVMGVSELCALPDGQLLVLEREAFIPKIKMGAFCKCKLYLINPLGEKKLWLSEDKKESKSIFSQVYSSENKEKGTFSEKTLGDDTPFLKKRLLTEWQTHLSLFDFSFANYEGMCLGPKLSDGSQVIILLSDSQDQYAGILKDWFKTIIIK